MPIPQKNNDHGYGAEVIQVLEGLEAIRKRPGMYLGNVHDGSALHQLVREVLDNSLREHLDGHGTRIEVRLADDGQVTINDHGRGIPVAITPEQGVSTVEVVMTKLHAGGKFNNNTYAISARPHGVGVSAVNAVSEELIVETRREGRLWRQVYHRGIPDAPLAAIRDLAPGEATGTRLSFRPDPQIFPSILRPDPTRVRLRLQELACLYPSLTLTLTEGSQEDIFHTTDGISSLVSSWCRCRRAMLPDIAHFSCTGKTDDGAPLWAEVALQFVEDGPSLRAGWLNDHRILAGTPFLGATAGILLGVRRAAKALSLPMKRGLAALLSERIVLVVRMEHPSPEHGSRTRDNVKNKDITRLLRQGLGAQLRNHLIEHPAELRRILEGSGLPEQRNRREGAAARQREAGAVIVVMKRQFDRNQADFGNNGVPPPHLCAHRASCFVAAV